MKESKQFIWSCTKFLASILCALSTTLWWTLGTMLPLVWKRVRKELGPAAGNFYREHMREKQTPADESDETEKN